MDTREFSLWIIYLCDFPWILCELSMTCRELSVNCPWILVNSLWIINEFSVSSRACSVNYRWHLVNCLWVLENYHWILVMSLWILSILVNSLSYRWMPVNALWILHEFSQNSRKILIEVSMCCSVNLTEFSRQYQGMLADWSVSVVCIINAFEGILHGTYRQNSMILHGEFNENP